MANEHYDLVINSGRVMDPESRLYKALTRKE